MPHFALPATSEPDFGRIEMVLRRRGEPDRVPFFELFSNIEQEVLRALGLFDESGLAAQGRQRDERQMRQHVVYQRALGYDYVNVGASGFSFPQRERPTVMGAQGPRSYVPADFPTIATWEEFERYPWPRMEDVDYWPVERMAEIVPDGMKAIVMGPGGVLENVMWLLSYAGIGYLLYDDEPLVAAMFDEVGTRLVAYFDALASFDVVGGMILGDDMGFKTQIMLSPAVFRKYVFPWHRKLVDVVHRHGKPIALHACGNLSVVMGDVIACGWDAKHSFEDVIEPVWETKRRYGDRIALLGGFDLDAICRMSEAEIRAHTRALIERCAPGGGWALGTGNSVANYIPVESFLTMIDEGLRAGRY